MAAAAAAAAATVDDDVVEADWRGLVTEAVRLQVRADARWRQLGVALRAVFTDRAALERARDTVKAAIIAAFPEADRAAFAAHKRGSKVLTTPAGEAAYKHYARVRHRADEYFRQVLNCAYPPLELTAAVSPVADVVAALPDYFTQILASMHNTGKSLLVRYELRALIAAKRVAARDVVVFSDNPRRDAEYKFLIELGGRVAPFTVDAFERVRLPHERVAVADYNATPHRLLVLDDVLGGEADRARCVQAVFTRGRHVKLSRILISQVANHVLTPIIRANSDSILFSVLNKAQMKTIHGCFPGDRPTEREFMAWVSKHVGRDFAFGVYSAPTAHADGVVVRDFMLAKVYDSDRLQYTLGGMTLPRVAPGDVATFIASEDGDADAVIVVDDAGAPPVAAPVVKATTVAAPVVKATTVAAPVVKPPPAPMPPPAPALAKALSADAFTVGAGEPTALRVSDVAAALRALPRLDPPIRVVWDPLNYAVVQEAIAACGLDWLDAAPFDILTELPDEPADVQLLLSVPGAATEAYVEAAQAQGWPFLLYTDLARARAVCADADDACIMVVQRPRVDDVDGGALRLARGHCWLAGNCRFGGALLRFLEPDDDDDLAADDVDDDGREAAPAAKRARGGCMA